MHWHINYGNNKIKISPQNEQIIQLYGNKIVL